MARASRVTNLESNMDRLTNWYLSATLILVADLAFFAALLR